MKQLGEPPKPFAQSAQYKKNFNKEVDTTDGGEIDDPGAPTDKPKKKKSPKKKKKRPEVKNLKKVNLEDEAMNDTGYAPQEYSKLRQQFINTIKDDRGLSHTEAVEAWNQSRQKRILLAPVSVSELKRRKFIPKGCDHNPWAD